MSNLLPEKVKASIDNFIKATELAGKKVSKGFVEEECLLAPHRPPSSLPQGKMAVYAFFCRGQCLKVGKVGSNAGRGTQASIIIRRAHVAI